MYNHHRESLSNDYPVPHTKCTFILQKLANKTVRRWNTYVYYYLHNLFVETETIKIWLVLTYTKQTSFLEQVELPSASAEQP